MASFKKYLKWSYNDIVDIKAQIVIYIYIYNDKFLWSILEWKVNRVKLKKKTLTLNSKYHAEKCGLIWYDIT